jgi:hypothetical protein
MAVRGVRSGGRPVASREKAPGRPYETMSENVCVAARPTPFVAVMVIW